MHRGSGTEPAGHDHDVGRRQFVEGRIGGFYKDICLLEQPYAKDDKVSIEKLIGSATIVRFAQLEIG